MLLRPFLAAISTVLLGYGWNAPQDGIRRERIDAIVASAMAEQHIPGVALSVVKDGQVAYTKGYGQANVADNTPMTASTPVQVGSCTKTLTAVSVLMLYDHPEWITKPGISKLDLDGTLGSYLNDRPPFRLPEKWRGFTIRQVLSMTSGAPKGASNDLPWPQIIDQHQDEVSFSPPGSWYCYSNPGYMVLGELISQLSGKAYHEFVAEHIFRPLGMTSSRLPIGETLPPGVATGYHWNGSSFEPSWIRAPRSSFSSGALVTTAEDFGKWTQALMTGQLLSPDAYKQMLTPQEIRDGSAHFGLGWAVSRPDLGIFQKDGSVPGVSAFIACYKNQGIAVTVQTNQGDANVAEIARAVASEVAGVELTHPIPPPADCTPLN